MTASLHFSYVQARAQARLASLPREPDWQRLEATRSLAAFLEEARATALKPWVAGLSGGSEAHAVTRSSMAPSAAGLTRECVAGPRARTAGSVGMRGSPALQQRAF